MKPPPKLIDFLYFITKKIKNCCLSDKDKQITIISTFCDCEIIIKFGGRSCKTLFATATVPRLQAVADSSESVRLRLVPSDPNSFVKFIGYGPCLSNHVRDQWHGNLSVSHTDSLSAHVQGPVGATGGFHERDWTGGGTDAFPPHRQRTEERHPLQCSIFFIPGRPPGRRKKSIQFVRIDNRQRIS